MLCPKKLTNVNPEMELWPHAVTKNTVSQWKEHLLGESRVLNSTFNIAANLLLNVTQLGLIY